VVNADHVTANGLFVEHYQRYDVIWNGEDGTTVMFQNEMPYDPPDQASWQHDGRALPRPAHRVAQPRGDDRSRGQRRRRPGDARPRRAEQRGRIPMSVMRAPLIQRRRAA
jgi:hypothetical protein